MRKLVLSVLISLFVANVVFASIGKVSVETVMRSNIVVLKNSTSNDSVQYVGIRQTVEDYIQDHSDDIDASDLVKLNALVAEIQDIIEACNDLNTKLNTHFPNVE